MENNKGLGIATLIFSILNTLGIAAIIVYLILVIGWPF